MQRQRFTELIEKYLDESIDQSEMKELAVFLRDTQYSSTLDELVLKPLQDDAERFEIGQDTKQAIYQYLDHQISSTSNPGSHTISRIHFLRKWGWAAAVILIAGAAALGITVFSKAKSNILQNHQHKDVAKISPTPILPGGEKAVLILADGSEIRLDSAGNGLLAEQGTSRIEKPANGEIRYSNPQAPTSEAMLNTMRTPKGGQYKLTLPDGSKAWLNAASSIRYPTAFTGASRVVEVEGEVYLEVAKNSRQPFIVKTYGETVQVLGTSFNVNAYKDETAISTTLIEGSIQVKVADKATIIRPGQQCLAANGRASVIDKADVDQVLAWKNGYFQLDKADIETIMREVERWYDVQVVYEGAKPTDYYRGRIRRDASLDEMLQIIAASGVQYRIDGRKIIILNKK